MTIHECRVCYPGYAAKERELETKAAFREIWIDKQKRNVIVRNETCPDAEYESDRALTPDQKEAGDGG